MNKAAIAFGCNPPALTVAGTWHKLVRQILGKSVQHRHLNHQAFTPAAVDDIISRGRWQDWAEMRRGILANRSLLDVVEQVCRQYIADPYAQRHHFWMNYVRQHKIA